MTGQKIKKKAIIFLVLVTSIFIVTGCGINEITKSLEIAPDSVQSEETAPKIESENESLKAEDVPPYEDSEFIVINDNEPAFSEEGMKSESFESYSPQDELGRCRGAYACVGEDLMPKEKRGSIGMIKPSGWHTVRYDDLVEGKYLYNRCHLIGYQLTGENANERNLITGTRYFNTEGMLPFEEIIADYVKNTGNHVLYRVSPIYKDNDLVAIGVQMEAISVEDGGDGVKFNVFVYNIQPGVSIDYRTGESHRM